MYTNNIEYLTHKESLFAVRLDLYLLKDFLFKFSDIFLNNV